MIGKRTRGPLFSIEREQTVPLGIGEVFGFFSDPSNLEAITPPWLEFRIQACSTPTVRAGTLIDYRLRVRGVPIRWRSLIRCWKPPFGFVDEQVKGPYRLWVHHHSFQETDGGVLVRDHVDYAVPGGALVHSLFVRKDLERIFDHRRDSLTALLNPGEHAA